MRNLKQNLKQKTKQSFMQNSLAALVISSAALLGGSVVLAQAAPKAPVLDGYPVAVELVKVVPGSTNAERIMATVSYPFGCGTTQALVVVGTYPLYNIYSVNDHKRSQAMRCSAFSTESAQIKVDEFIGTRPDVTLIKVNGTTVTN